MDHTQVKWNPKDERYGGIVIVDDIFDELSTQPIRRCYKNRPPKQTFDGMITWYEVAKNLPLKWSLQTLPRTLGNIYTGDIEQLDKTKYDWDHSILPDGISILIGSIAYDFDHILGHHEDYYLKFDVVLPMELNTIQNYVGKYDKNKKQTYLVPQPNGTNIELGNRRISALILDPVYVDFDASYIWPDICALARKLKIKVKDYKVKKSLGLI